MILKSLVIENLRSINTFNMKFEPGINLIYGIVFGITWILIFMISKYSSLSSLIGSLSIPIYLFIFNENQIVFFVIMFVLIFYTHRENIKRLKNKEESKSKIY